MIAVSYIMKRKIKKIFYEVISNSKIFKIIFFNKIVNDQDFPKLTGGLDSVEYSIYYFGFLSNEEFLCLITDDTRKVNKFCDFLMYFSICYYFCKNEYNIRMNSYTW